MHSWESAQHAVLKGTRRNSFCGMKHDVAVGEAGKNKKIRLAMAGSFE